MTPTLATSTNTSDDVLWIAVAGGVISTTKTDTPAEPPRDERKRYC